MTAKYFCNENNLLVISYFSYSVFINIFYKKNVPGILF